MVGRKSDHWAGLCGQRGNHPKRRPVRSNEYTRRLPHTQLQHIVGSAGAFIVTLRAIAIDAGAGFADQPAAVMAELEAQLVGMHMGEMLGARNAALEYQFPTVARPQQGPTCVGRSVTTA